MEEILYEAKFEVAFDSEKETIQKLGLQFLREYYDTDYYLKSSAGKAMKMKFLEDNKVILYQIVSERGCFKILGKDITISDKDRILQFNPIKLKIDRHKKVYLFKKFNVKVDFDYMKQFPDRLFLEIHSDSKENVLKAKRYAQEKLSLKRPITIAYDKLLEK